MSRAWMPFYVSDYLADTGHLTTAEHGAYMLLIMHYWSNGGLPDDDRKLARICRMSPDEWRDVRETLSDFFHDGWRHKRIDAEFLKAAERSEKASAAAGRRWAKPQPDADADAMRTHSEGICEGNAKAMLSQSQSHILSSNEDNTREPTARDVLLECLSEKTAADVIAHRQAKKSKLTPRAARELVNAFQKFGDPEAAAAEMILRGWTGFKPDWMVQATSPPGSNVTQFGKPKERDLRNVPDTLLSADDYWKKRKQLKEWA
jgi:uncharacterized protein YdaU (DUF1376 family)